jgi:hypothetical protein
MVPADRSLTVRTCPTSLVPEAGSCNAARAAGPENRANRSDCALNRHPGFPGAAGLPLLSPDDSELSEDLDKVKAGRKLFPGAAGRGNPTLWVAGGYRSTDR